MSQDHGGNIKEVAEKFNLNEDKIVDFSANINFVGPPPDVYRIIKNELKSIERYPETNSKGIKQRLANKYNLELNNLIIGNGAAELIYLLAKVMDVKKGLILAPTFSEYEKALKSEDVDIKYHYLKQENDFQIEIDRLKKDLKKDIDIFFLCNPNNPTGTFINKVDIQNILEHNKDKGIFTVIDEAFIDFVDRNISALSLLKDYNHLFILRSLTKFFAVPGLRLGYGVGHKELLDKMNMGKDPWNVNILAQKAAEVILHQDQYEKLTKKAIYQEKIFLYKKLQEIENIKVYYPNANYIFIDLNNAKLKASQLYSKLSQEGILIRNCSNYQGLDDNYIRIAVKSRQENKKLIANFKKLLNHK